MNRHFVGIAQLYSVATITVAGVVTARPQGADLDGRRCDEPSLNHGRHPHCSTPAVPRNSTEKLRLQIVMHGTENGPQ